MRFARRLVLLPLLSLLTACSPITPLFVAQATTSEVAEYKQMKSSHMIAATEGGGDLLTYSAMMIRNNRSAEAEKLYPTGCDSSRYSAEVRGILLYQVGLIYMSRYNDQRDDTKAADYFQRVVRKFPGTHAVEYAQACLLAMCQRAREPVQKSTRELLATWKPQRDLDLHKTSLNPDMALLLRHAVFEDRADEAAELYLLVVDDPAVPAGIKEKALYQLGLIYLAPDNPHPNRDKAIEYLRRQLFDYPEGELSNKASWHLDQTLNVQPR